MSERRGENKGYRVDRLRRRRRTRAERWQSWVLYSLAGVVAFAAVLGAWYMGSRLLGGHEKPKKSGFIALVKLTDQSGTPVASALAIKDVSNGAFSLYVVPSKLLLTGAQGEYVFAGDSLSDGTLKADLERLIRVNIDGEATVPVAKLADLAGQGGVELQLQQPVTVDVGGSEETYKGKTSIAASDIPALFAASGQNGEDADLQVALWQAVLDTAALQPDDVRARLVESAAGGSPFSGGREYVRDALTGLTQGDAAVASVPATSRVAEGQFALVPDPEGIMAEITRQSPAYHSRYTVLVRNGTGKIGVAQAVADRLATLDVNVPQVGNADNFDYSRTQIIAGRQALQVAQNIRAILGRGVVLDGGADLGPTTVVVIVGRDLKVNDVKAKD